VGEPCRRRRHRGLWFGIAAIVVAAGTAPSSQQRGLTAAPRLARAYDAIVDARFDDVPALLNETCPPAPPEACRLLEVMALWWRIQLDPLDTSRDTLFRAKADETIAAAQAWTRREPDRAEAWFYLGGAYAARTQWRVLRGERLAAARDGGQIKEALERAIALDPKLGDAWFGIGMYRYYAAVAPAATRVLRWLLLLPGGNRSEGLRQMLRARAGGELLRSEADYQLHLIYLWYEQQPERALELLQDLQKRHPHNPHFLRSIAELEENTLHDPVGSLRSWQRLLEAARAHRVAEPAMAAVVARIGIARQLDRLYESDAALPHLHDVIDVRPPAPIGAVAEAHLQLGTALDRLGMRDEAVAAYRAAIAAAPPGDPLRIAQRARRGLERRPPRAETAAFRRSLDGWRALERGDLAGARRALEEAMVLAPDDMVARYRYARVLVAAERVDDALTALADVHRRRGQTPDEFYLRACVEAAGIHERLGAVRIAADLYRTALTVAGGDRRLKEQARRALATLKPL
jgi:tetratricopeptide (TPR) repeat protein